MRRMFVLAVALAAVLLSLPVARSSAANPRLHMSPCSTRKGDRSICGTFDVREDRTQRGGRTIPVGFILMPATHPSHHAIVFEAGGPGQSATGLVPMMATGAFGYLQPLHDTYDILFVDDRGIGRSNAFDCDWNPAARPQLAMMQLFPDEISKACHAKYATARDLNAYDTNNSADDLDELRAALGYKKLVLSGGSYGTTFSLVYLRRHPASVESEVLDGVAAPGSLPLLGSPDGAQHAMDRIIADCKIDTVCKTHFPKFEEHFAALMQRFARGPIPVPVRNQVTKNLETLPLSKEVLVDRLRQLSYDPDGASVLPAVVEEAYDGNYADLAAVVGLVTSEIDSQVNMAANLTYACAEFMPFYTSAQIKNAARGSYTGDLRLRAEQNACKVWNVRPMPPGYDTPVKSDAPILMMTGSDDPATPPESAAAALKYLPNAKQILVTGGGHGNESPCIDAAIVSFVRAKSAKNVDAAKCSVPRGHIHFSANADWLKKYE